MFILLINIYSKHKKVAILHIYRTATLYKITANITYAARNVCMYVCMYELDISSCIEKPLLICNKLLRIYCKYSKNKWFLQIVIHLFTLYPLRNSGARYSLRSSVRRQYFDKLSNRLRDRQKRSQPLI